MNAFVTRDQIPTIVAIVPPHILEEERHPEDDKRLLIYSQFFAIEKLGSKRYNNSSTYSS